MILKKLNIEIFPVFHLRIIFLIESHKEKHEEKHEKKHEKKHKDHLIKNFDKKL